MGVVGFSGGRIEKIAELARSIWYASIGAVLALLGQDQPFYVAFEAATGESLTGAVDRFWKRQRAWTWWLAFLTGPAFLWSVITLLALYAISVHRRRRAEQRRRWDEEEPAAPRHPLDTDTPASGTSYEVH